MLNNKSEMPMTVIWITDLRQQLVKGSRGPHE